MGPGGDGVAPHASAPKQSKEGSRVEVLGLEFMVYCYGFLGCLLIPGSLSGYSFGRHDDSQNPNPFVTTAALLGPRFFSNYNHRRMTGNEIVFRHASIMQ